jgi:hypothetical protein
MQATPFAQDGLAGAPPTAEAFEQLMHEERNARRTAEQQAQELANKLDETRTAQQNAEQKVTELTNKLSREGAVQASAQRGTDEVRSLLTQLEQTRIAKEAAEKAAKEATDLRDRAWAGKVVAERIAKETASKCEHEQSHLAKDALDRLARERSARAAAELATNELRNQLGAVGAAPQDRIHDLRRNLEAEQRARIKLESEATDAKLQLAQEKQSRDATERALKQAQQKLAANEGSCWACPAGTPCERPPMPMR